MRHLPHLLRRVGAVAAAGLLLTACVADEVVNGEDDTDGQADGVELEASGPACDELLDGQLLGSSDTDLEGALADHPELTLTSELLEEVELDPGPGDFERPTFLAPTDAAIEDQLPVQERADLIADEPALRDVLGLHLLPETWTLAELGEQELVGTVQGQDLVLATTDGTVSFSSLSTGTVLCGDIALADAVVHVIDAVLLPDTAAQTDEATDGG